MEIDDAKRIIEAVRELPVDRRYVAFDTPEFTALVRYCPYFSVRDWRLMRGPQRWAWLAHLTTPGVTAAEGARIVDEAASEASDELMARIDRRIEAQAGARLERQSREARAAHEHLRAEIDRQIAMMPAPTPRPKRRRA